MSEPPDQPPPDEHDRGQQDRELESQLRMQDSDDEAGGDDDDEALVPLGDVLLALDRERQQAAQETASELLRRTRTMPHALDAERAVLGALMLEPSSYESVVDEDGLHAGLRRIDGFGGGQPPAQQPHAHVRLSLLRSAL